MKKTYIKKNLISFVIGLILFGSIGVYAIVTFQSKDVSYENVASGLASKNVQGAIDELYEECTKVPTSGGTILDNEEIVSSGDGLYEDTYEEGRYIYKGKNVNNYITFNNETWRIISIEKNETIKIMREASIGEMAWDSSNSDNWIRPASLNTYLNGSYLTGTLNSTSQGQITLGNFGIGEVTWDNNDLANQINDENGSIWNGKIALPTVSEYVRANSNVDGCGSFYLTHHNGSDCKATNWMSNNEKWWTLTGGTLIYYVNNNGHFNYGSSSGSTGVRPAVYLSSEVKITGGDGSQNNPYTLG